MLRVLCLTVALLCLAPVQAAPAKPRYGGCAVEGKGGPCRHLFRGGNLIYARFTDRTDEKAKYTVAVFRRGHKRAVVDKVRSRRYVDISRGLRVGRYTIRWYVGGAEVAKWRFRYVAEND